jgi:hypothetical protein
VGRAGGSRAGKAGPGVGNRVAARRAGKAEVRVAGVNRVVGASKVAARRVAGKEVRVEAVSRVAEAVSRVVARKVVGKGGRVVKEVRAEVEARRSDRVAGRAGLVEARVDREVVRGKKVELSDGN